MIAKIREVAAEEDVKCHIDESFVSKIKARFDLPDSIYFMELDIPYNNYQYMLQNLQMAIQSLKGLYEKGIQVKVKRY